MCCSKYGYCGTTTDYCGNGCQTKYGICNLKNADESSDTDGRCGPNYGKCPNNGCCSKYGYCGYDDSYCGTGCNPKYGLCNSTDGTCGNGKRCPNNGCCSKYGYCGKSDEYCESECNPNYGKCSNYVTALHRQKTNAINDIKRTMNMNDNEAEDFYKSTDGIISKFMDDYINSHINNYSNNKKKLFNNDFYEQCPKYCENVEKQLKSSNSNFDFTKLNNYLKKHNHTTLNSTTLLNMCIR